jgi:hypothetical protein
MRVGQTMSWNDCVLLMRLSPSRLMSRATTPFPFPSSPPPRGPFWGLNQNEQLTNNNTTHQTEAMMPYDIPSKKSTEFHRTELDIDAVANSILPDSSQLSLMRRGARRRTVQTTVTPTWERYPPFHRNSLLSSSRSGMVFIAGTRPDETTCVLPARVPGAMGRAFPHASPPHAFLGFD